MTIVEMKTLSKLSDEQKNIKILNESIDKINETLTDGQKAYEFMQKQTSKAEGTVNKKSHEEDLKKFKDRIDDLERVKKEIKSEILKFEKKIAAKLKKGGRRTRKKRGKGRKSRKKKRKSKRNKRRTRRAGTLKQSKIPGERGLTDREKKLRLRSTLKQSKIPGERGLTEHEKNLRRKRRRIRLEKVAKNIGAKLFGVHDQFSNLSIQRQRSLSPPGFDVFMKNHNSPPTTPLSGGKKTRKKRRRKRRR